MKVQQPTFKGAICALAVLFMSCATLLAQRVSGIVLDAETNEALPGASVMVKNTTRGTSSDGNGKFVMEAKVGEVLVVSYVGYDQQEISIGASITFEIRLIGGKLLDEAVVTGLGFKKDKARLGYATQEVKGADLLKAREPNPINSLVGKVAGLTVGASTELLGAPSLSLRGSTPIFVVDGVPINSDTWNISADDIETYTVLKGPAAAALYGFRSQDGVIMITTKKGVSGRTTVEFNTSQMMEKGFNALPTVQDEYGPGDHGRYSFVDGRGGGLNDGDYDVWGPRFEGQALPQYDSPIDAQTGERTATPWTARGTDNLERFLRPGFQSNNNIAVTTGTDKSQFRYSTSYNYTGGMVPNTQLNVANFNVSGGLDFSDKIRLEANINYNRQFTDNIPDVQYGPNSMIYNIIIWGAADWNVDDMQNYWQPGKEGTQQIYAEYQRYNNPWFLAKEWLRGHQKTDVFGQTAISYKFAPGFSAKLRTAVTTYDLTRSEKFPYSATVYGREEARGDYREDKRSLFENNTDLTINMDKNIGDNFSVNALVGGNIRSFQYNSSYVTTDYLNVPGLYTFSNSSNPIKAFDFDSKMLVNSGFYSADFGFKNIIFVNTTGRVDKLSTLPKGNNTFFYPSVSTSLVVSEMADLGPVSFLKLRAAYANVKAGLTAKTIGATPSAAYPIGYGSYYSSSYDGPTYENSSVYNSPLVYNNQPGSYFSNTISNANLQPLNRTNYEAGVEAKIMRNRIGVDLTWFRYVDGPQIFAVPLSEATGYTSQLVNAVKTQRQGWEATINGSPVRPEKPGDFSWDVLANWSTFKETFLELPTGLDRIYGFFEKGDRTDKYYDRAFVRTSDGQIINDGSGRPIINPTAQFLGNQNPDWVWGLYNKFSYKGLSLGIQFDGRVGGVITNYLRRQTFRGGRNIETTEGAMGAARLLDWENQKAGKYNNPQENGNWVGEGVVVSNGVAIQYDQFGKITNYDQLQFTQNGTKTFLQDYISRYYSPAEGSLMSRTFSKLREVTITYQMPEKWFAKGNIIRSASVSLVGRNLLYFAEFKDIDLDTYVGHNYSGAGYSDLQSPTAKRYGINLNVTF
jgi:TonB-linked SusC/RagA family outer membrane protein